MPLSNVKFLYRYKDESSEVPDAALLYACAQGETSALGILFERHHEAVYRFMSRMTGTEAQDIDDLVQETFIQVQRCAVKYKAKSSVKTWILGIAVNMVRRYCRDRKRRPYLVDPKSRAETPSASTPQKDLEYRDTLKCLAEAMQNLPLKQRSIFVLCDLEGVSGVEAAATLGIPQGTVWRRLHEARKTLREALGRGEQ